MPAQAAPAPKPSIANLQQLPVVTMQPYDEAANADAAGRRRFCPRAEIATSGC